MSNIQLQLIILFVLFIPSVFSSSPLLSYQAPLVETGFFDLYQSSLGLDPASSTYKFNYNVTLQRLPNTSPSDYKVLMGYYSLNYQIGYDMANLNRFTLFRGSKLATSFQIKTEFSDLSKIYYAKISYIAINNQLCQTYILFFNQTINAANFTTVTTHHFPGIANIGQPYKNVMTMIELKSGYSDSTSNTALLDIWMKNQIDSQHYDVEVISTNVYIEILTVDILFIDPVWMNTNTKAQRFKNIYWMQIGSTDTTLLIYSDPTLPIFNTNHFIGLTSFKIINTMLIYNCRNANDYMWIDFKSTTHMIKGYLIAVAHKYCTLPYSYDKIADTCIECQPDCLRCEPTLCLECAHNFTIAVDMVSCTCPYPVVSHTCFDYDNSPMKGCENAFFDPVTFHVSCNFCSLSKKLTLVDGDCVCQSGYEHNNVTNNCTQICGDGQAFQSQCDDGNNIDGDGCSSTCKVQNNFKCDKTLQPSYCTALFQLRFLIVSVMKNEDNSAVIKLQTKFKNLPFPLLQEQFINTSQGEPIIFTLRVTNPWTGEITDIPLSLISFKNNEIELKFDIPFRIESFPAQLTIDPYKTRYLPQKDVHSFTLTGTNQPLKYSNNMSLLKSGSIGAMIQGIIMLVLLLVGLLAPKYIALQGVLTLQLIFFSQLLIYNNKQWSLGFNIFKNFRYINGYNIGVIEMTEYYLNSNINKKYYNLMIQKTFVENFNTSGVVLILCFVAYVVAMMVYRGKEEKFFDFKSIMNELSSMELTELNEEYDYWHKISNFLHNVLSQISMWCILQVLCGVSGSIQVSNSSVTVLSFELSNSLLKFQGIFFIITFTIIFIVGLNYFRNLLMSTTTLGRWKDRWQEWLYKRAVFIYLIVMGCVVFFLNDINMTVPASAIALIIHLFYMLLLLKINPYKLSLRIHTVSLWLCQFLYLIFLLFVNTINLISTYTPLIQIPEIITIILCYFILICAFAIITISFIRLYYEYRYGEQLQKQILQQRQQQQKRKKLQQQLKLNKKIQLLQNQKLSSLDQKQQQLIKNQYLYDNVSKQQAMIQLLSWLQTRTNWTKQQKEKYYYQRFHVKPLQYLKKHDDKQYQKMMNEHNSYRNREMEKSRKLKLDYELKEIKQRIKSYKINNENKKLYNNNNNDNKNNNKNNILLKNNKNNNWDKSLINKVKIQEKDDDNKQQQGNNLIKYGKL